MNNNNIIEDGSFFAEILKKSGYKSLSFAMAEIIDNALDAYAKNVIILAESERPNSNIKQLGFLDDGRGMGPELLVKALKVGGRLTEQYRGRTGKFGFGLPGASIANSDLVHVYSWTKESPGTVYKVSLDANNFNAGIIGPEESTLPEPYAKFLSSKDLIIRSGDEKTDELDFTESGTLILWDGCERVTPKRPKTILEKQVKKSLGRLFRHFITKDRSRSSKFKEINIYWMHDLISGSKSTLHKVRPNDPLYLMTDNQLADIEVPLIFDKQMTKPIDINGSELKATYSLASRTVRNAYKGKGLINDEVGLNQGISILREGREIDFGSFGFIDSDVRHRWHGMEIHFQDCLDDYFGVPANKQHVDKLRKYDPDEGEFSEETPDEELPIFILLQDKFKVSDTLNEYQRIIRGYGRSIPDDPGLDDPGLGGPGLGDPGLGGHDVTDDPGEDNGGSTSGGPGDDDEARENVIKILISLGYNPPTEKQINRFLQHQIVWEEVANGGSAGFMDVRIKHGYCILVINTDSSFYTEVLLELNELDQENDTSVTRGVELILLAYARCMDLGRNLEGENGKMFRKVLTKWSQKSEEFIEDYYNQ